MRTMKSVTIYAVEYHAGKNLMAYQGIYRYHLCQTLEDARRIARRWVELDMWDDEEWKEDEDALMWQGPSDRIEIQTWTI